MANVKISDLTEDTVVDDNDWIETEQAGGTSKKALVKRIRRTLLTILQRTTSLSISNSTWTDVSWDTTVVQDDVGAFASGSPTIVTVPTGYTKVRAVFYGPWTNNSTGVRYAQLMKNGSTTLEVATQTAANEGGPRIATRWHTVAAADTLKFQVNQTSGGALNFSPTGGFGAPATVQFEWGK